MKWLVSSACVFSVLLFTAYAAPASTGLQVSASGSGGGLSGGGGLGNILSNIDLPGLLQGLNSFVKLIGAFCPPLSQVLDNVIQNVTSTAFRVFGRAILRSGGLGGGSGASGGDSGQRVNVVLPTFPPDEDYEDDEAESVTGASTSAAFAQELEAVTDASEIDDDTANTIAKRHVRVARETAAESAAADQEGAESAPQPEQDSNGVDDQDRNKRYSPFGASDDGHEGAGSGNFLFDIIRLVAGSGATEESDDHEAGGVAELDVQKSTDGHTEGIPGPITRLFVIANRGLANLVQDLILRLAQTSERLVNFKARLITALI
ncbi:hypothetical protein D910_11767 [Dendroctonus ponderosae]|uniref:Uncharacterized protein n=1 Tax=Dendroctonus ponderosae TaxID=77166 RepID=U4UW77_DENPD|nr:hypothetical protein D910_11767 [Dendroctonus ponderosae]